MAATIKSHTNGTLTNGTAAPGKNASGTAYPKPNAEQRRFYTDQQYAGTIASIDRTYEIVENTETGAAMIFALAWDGKTFSKEPRFVRSESNAYTALRRAVSMAEAENYAQWKLEREAEKKAKTNGEKTEKTDKTDSKKTAAKK